MISQYLTKLKLQLTDDWRKFYLAYSFWVNVAGTTVVGAFANDPDFRAWVLGTVGLGTAANITAATFIVSIVVKLLKQRALEKARLSGALEKALAVPPVPLADPVRVTAVGPTAVLVSATAAAPIEVDAPVVPPTL